MSAAEQPRMRNAADGIAEFVGEAEEPARMLLAEEERVDRPGVLEHRQELELRVLEAVEHAEEWRRGAYEVTLDLHFMSARYSSFEGVSARPIRMTGPCTYD